MGENLHAVEAVILLLLVIVIFFAAMARRLKTPYPIVLVLAGLIISFLPRIPRIPLDPQLVFLIFLPPLLYSGAWMISWREVRRNAIVLVLLVFGLVGFTVLAIAFFSDRFITALDWKAGFLFGAVLSTTDAIAATSIAQSLGLPRRIVDILEGESLFNDATGLLALETALGMMNGEMPTLAGGVARLMWLVVGGIAVGLLFGVAVAWIEQFVDDGPIEVAMSLVVPYAAYLAGDAAHVSGVLAVVACGIYMSRKSSSLFSPEVRLQLFSGWQSLTFILNGLVFVLIGLQLPYVLEGIRGRYTLGTLIFYGAAFSAVLILLRLIWVYPAIQFAHYVKTRWLHKPERPYSQRGIFVIGWTGMRGVVALAAAISIPETLNGQPFMVRNLIVFLTFCVILVTLVLQGLTLPAVIRALGLARPATVEPEELDARRRSFEAAIAWLKNAKATDDPAFAHVYDDVMHRYEHRLAAVLDMASAPVDGTKQQQSLDRAIYMKLRMVQDEALEVERSTLLDLRSRGVIGDDVLRTLQRELDLAESRGRTQPR